MFVMTYLIILIYFQESLLKMRRSLWCDLINEQSVLWQEILLSWKVERKTCTKRERARSDRGHLEFWIFIETQLNKKDLRNKSSVVLERRRVKNVWVGGETKVNLSSMWYSLYSGCIHRALDLGAGLAVQLKKLDLEVSSSLASKWWLIVGQHVQNIFYVSSILYFL